MFYSNQHQKESIEGRAMGARDALFYSGGECSREVLGVCTGWWKVRGGGGGGGGCVCCVCVFGGGGKLYVCALREGKKGGGGCLEGERVVYVCLEGEKRGGGCKSV